MKFRRYICGSLFSLLCGVGAVPLAFAEETFDEQTLYDILLGEVAAQRGQMDIAADSLGRAARRTHDPRLTERATLSALYAKRFEEAYQSATLWVEIQPSAPDALEALATALLELD